MNRALALQGPHLPGDLAPGLTAGAGRLTAGPALTLEWLDGCGLFKPLDE